MTTHGPLVVMTRTGDARGWSLHVDPKRVQLEGARVEVVGEEVRLFDRERDRVLPVGVAARVGTLEVVCFIAHEQPRPPPGPALLKAVEAVRANDTNAGRRVLADALEEQGLLPEAHYVRLELELNEAPMGERFSEGVRKLKALSTVVGPTFRYLVGRDIDGCSGVRWAFRCPKPWQSMTPTEQDDERICTTCKQVVVRVETEAGAAELARAGVCARVEVTEMDWVGEVAAPDDRGVAEWVGSLAMPPPTPPRSPVPQAAPAVQKVPWWRRLFGRG